MSDVALRFSAKDAGLNAAFSRVNAMLDGFKANAERAAAGVDKIYKGVVAIGAVTALATFASSAIAAADAIVKMNAATGISITRVQELQFLASQADVEIGSLTSGIARLQRALVSADEGQKEAGKSLKALGINTAEFFRLEPDKQFEQVALKIASIQDPARRTDAAMDLFGRGGAELLPLMQAIARESDALGVSFARIGGPMGEETVARLDALGDAASATWLSVKSLGSELLALAAPAVLSAMRGVQEFFGALRFSISGPSDRVMQINEEIEALEDANRKIFAFRDGQEPEAKRRNIRRIAELEAERRRLYGLDRPFELQSGTLPSIDDLIAIGPDAPDIETEEERKAREERENERFLIRYNAEREYREMAIRDAENDIERYKKIEDQRLQDAIEREMQIAASKVRVHTDLENFLASVRETFRIKEINLEKIKNQSLLSLAGEMFGSLARENSKFAKLQQGIALAQTIWYTSAGIMNAFRTLPWPANLAAAAKVAITGAIQVAKIRSTNYHGGGGSAPSIGGGTTAAASEQTQTPIEQPSDTRGSTTIYMSGFITREVVDQMMAAIRGEFNRDVILIPNNSLQAQVIRES